MRIHNLKAPPETVTIPGGQPDDTTPATASLAARGSIMIPQTTGTPPVSDIAGPTGHEALEIAFLKARIQHLKLVVETARSLMGSNHERLLRRLHEVPRELVELSNQLRRADLHTTW
jgi:hypothetical protein